MHIIRSQHNDFILAESELAFRKRHINKDVLKLNFCLRIPPKTVPQQRPKDYQREERLHHQSLVTLQLKINDHMGNLPIWFCCGCLVRLYFPAHHPSVSMVHNSEM